MISRSAAWPGAEISRYDPTQLPDATVGSRGQPVSLPGWEALAGLIGHPVPAMDLYGYLGTDGVSDRSFDTNVKGRVTAYGYGNPLYVNTGCEIELSPASTCAANTSRVVQGTVGAWYRLLHGPYGTMQVGAQYSYTRRFVFQGLGPRRKPTTTWCSSASGISRFSRVGWPSIRCRKQPKR